MKNVKKEHTFKLLKGGEIRNLQELEDKLLSMDHDTFIHHVNEERNDFYNWIKDIIKDNELAKKINHIRSRLLMKSIIHDKILELGGEEKEEQEKQKKSETKSKSSTVHSKQQDDYKESSQNFTPRLEHHEVKHVPVASTHSDLLTGIVEFTIGLTIGATGALIIAKYFM